MGITLGAADIIKAGVDEGSGLVSSCGSFGVTRVGNSESVGPREGGTLGN